MDYGGRLLDAGMQLQKGMALEYGSAGKVATVPEEAGVDASKVVFKQVRKSLSYSRRLYIIYRFSLYSS